jgi:eukaryotic-like serine/threonine-protein kinase
MLLVNSLVQLEFLNEIGGQEGRNSKVYLAYDKQLDSQVVVKSIDKTEFSKVEEYFAESQMLHAVSHPNIMGVKYASQDTDNVYIVLDYYKYGSLNNVINQRFLTTKEIIKYSLEFLSGIHYMHSKKLVHFDIKPTNILINDAGKAVVTDFGLAKYLNENGFAWPNKQYPFHILPESFRLGKFSVFSDIYQAGLTMYRLCNGNAHFKEQLTELNITTSTELHEAIKNDLFPKKDNFLPHIPIKLRVIIQKALAIDVEDRYESVLDMMNDISLLEENLHWVYNEDTNEHSYWIRNEGTHESRLDLIKVNNEWITEGYRKNLSNNNSQRVTKWNTSGYNSKELALKSITKLLTT